MNSIITELFYQYFELSEEFKKKQERSIENQKLEKIKNELLRNIPEDKHDIFFKYESSYNEYAVMENEEIFRFGVKIGMQLKKDLDELFNKTK